MATREFKSDFVNDLALQAQTGHDNHIINRWRSKCRESYDKKVAWSNQLWLRRLRALCFLPLKSFYSTFDEYCEESKAVLLPYSSTWTEWTNHAMFFSEEGNEIRNVIRLSEANNAAGKLTTLSGKTYRLLCECAAIERKT